MSLAEKPKIIVSADSLDRQNNLVFNVSFKEPHLEEETNFGGLLPGVDGDGYFYIAPNTALTPVAMIEGWTASGGGAKN